MRFGGGERGWSGNRLFAVRWANVFLEKGSGEELAGRSPSPSIKQSRKGKRPVCPGGFGRLKQICLGLSPLRGTKGYWCGNVWNSSSFGYRYKKLTKDWYILEESN